MLIARKKHFWRGVLMLAAFIVMFILIMSPIFRSSSDEPMTGLEYADEVFNALSKGSSYFIPEVKEGIKPVFGNALDTEINLRDMTLIPLALLLLENSGLEAHETNGKILVRGSLGRMLDSVITDSEALYHNQGASLSEKYEENTPLQVARCWWAMLSPMVKKFQKEGKLADAGAVDLVLRKALEPGNNFYGIIPMEVERNIPLVAGLLVFYVFYAIWYGFGIYEIFEGLGLVAAQKAE